MQEKYKIILFSYISKIKFMTEDIKINIPNSQRDIKLSQWMKYSKILEKNKDAENNEFLNKKALEIFCDMDYKDIDKLPFSSFNGVIEHLSSIISAESELVQKFRLIGTDGVEVEFGFIPDLHKMSYGEYKDLEMYIFDEQNMHKAMAVLYRPIKYKKGDRYLIHDYEGTEYLKDVMRDTPLDAALGAKGFFLSFSEKIRSLYDGLYTQTVTGGRGSQLRESFGKKWGDYQAIHALAQGDVTRIGEVTKIGIHQCMMWLEYEKEKNDLENKLLKQQSR